MMERVQRQHSETNTYSDRCKFIVPTEATTEQLEIYDNVVRIDDSSYGGTIILPSVAEAAGLIFDINVTSGSNDWVIQAFSITGHGGSAYPDSLDWAAITLTADEDSVSLRSNGRTWIVNESRAT
jgi:hypothetical protein